MTKQGKLYWMKERLRTWVLIILSFLFVVVVSGVGGVWAEYCDEYGDKSGDEYYNCLETEKNKLLEESRMLREATAPLEEELNRLMKKITSFQYQIDQAKARQIEIGVEIGEREDSLSEQYLILAEKTREYYKRLRSTSFLSQLLSSMGTGATTREMAYRNDANERDRQIILQLSGEIGDLERDKMELEEQKGILAGLQAELNKEADFYGGEVAKAKDYQAVLSSQIASLSAKQQQVLAEKLGSLNLPSSLGAGPLYCTDDRNLNPGFSPAFAFYTFGIPHRVGMSQYGAYGRANEGQTYDQILRAYYNFDGYEDKGSTTIRVNNGNGINQGSVIWTGSLEDYVKRIYEIPASWPMASLQAQAIAARSYALAATSNGANSICANQWCQVFKTDPKGGDWEGAVNATAGKVMVSGGEIITAWYASTAGGYTFTNADIWWGTQRPWTKRLRDTNGDVGSFSDLLSKAYDRDSPCFYAAQGWRSEYGNSAWLKSEEVADIANVILLARKDSGTKSHLYQVDKPNPEGVENWDMERVKSELRSRNETPLNSVNDVSVSGVDWGTGLTGSITINGDTRSVNFERDEFKDFFNLRAPANIQIVGGLFNIERK